MPMPALSRRTLLAVGAAGALHGLTARAAASPAPGLDILAAPTGASIVLARLLENGALDAAAPGATLRLWRTTDDLRAAVVSGRATLFSTPTHVPANLSVRGLKLKLACLIGSGHLSVVTSDDRIHDLHDLAGKPVLTFFRHDMPDLVFRALARLEGMDADKDIRLSYVQTGMEAGQMLAAGRVQTALLSEPMASSAIMMAAKQGRVLRRAILLNPLWAKHKSRAGLPMVGVALHADLVEKSPEVVAALHQGVRHAASQVLADHQAAAKLAERRMGFPAAMFASALPHLNIGVRSAAQAKDDLQRFYRTLLELEPRSLGGRLPAEDFYLDV